MILTLQVYQLVRSLPHKSDILPAFMPVAKEATMQILQVPLEFIIHDFKTTEAICQTGCEKVRGKHTHTGFKHHVFTASRTSLWTNRLNVLRNALERCRCQAFQIKGEGRCELLDEDRFAAPDDFVEELGYKYYDMSRECEKLVTKEIVS